MVLASLTLAINMNLSLKNMLMAMATLMMVCIVGHIIELIPILLY